MSGMMMGAAALQMSGTPWLFDFSSKLTALPTALRRMNATYTRNSVKNVVQDGVLVQLAANQFGTSYDDVTGLYGYVPEPAATNLLTYSEQLDNAAWAKTNATISANATTAPDGTTTADLITRGSTAGAYTNQNVAKAASAITYTQSQYVQKSVGNYVALRLQGMYPNRADVVFNINTGAIHSAAAVVGTFTGATASIVAVGGWYRVTLSATTDTAIVVAPHISFNSNGVVVDDTDSASNSAGYIWGAQLETGSRATSYIATTGSTATRAADVLSVPLWVNRIPYSDSLSSASIQYATRTLAAANDPVTGALTASLITETVVTSQHYALHTVTMGSTASSVQLCLKANGRTKIKIRGESPQFNSLNTIYDLTGAGAVVSGTGTITALSNGWYFVTATTTGGTGASGYIVVQSLDAGLNEIYTGDGVSGFYVARMQAEAGSVATAYRPTTSTIESVANANIPGFSSAGYTLYADHRYATVPLNSRALLSTSDLSTNNTSFLIATSTIRGANVGVNGSNTSSVNLSNASTSRSKLAASFALASNRVALDGVGASPNLSGATPTELTTLEIGGLANGNQAGAFLFRAGFIPQALTQAQINALTVL